MFSRSVRLVMLSAVVMVGLVACGGEDPAVEPVASPSVEAETQDEGRSFEDVTSLVEAINEGGVPCEDMRLLDAPQESIEDFGLCFITPEYEKDIYLFRTAEDRDAWVEGFADSPGIHLLVGPNWFITSGSPDELAQIQAVIGGDLRPAP